MRDTLDREREALQTPDPVITGVPVDGEPPPPEEMMRRMVDAGLISGLFVAGKVLARLRRHVGVGDDAKEVVDYRLLTGDSVAQISEWEPGGRYYAVGSNVVLPVRVSAFHTPAGGAGYRLQTGQVDRAQAF